MSTKWNNNLRLQKPPKVCKFVPPPPDPPTTDFPNYPLQAFADWTEPGTPLEQSIAGYTSLTPDPLHNRHYGEIGATRARLTLTLQYIPPTLQFVYTIRLYVNDVFNDSVSVTFSNPPAKIPFAAGLFTWDDPTKPKLVHSKIYS